MLASAPGPLESGNKIESYPLRMASQGTVVMAAPGVPGVYPAIAQTHVFPGTDTVLSDLEAMAEPAWWEHQREQLAKEQRREGARSDRILLTGAGVPWRVPWGVLSYGHSESIIMAGSHPAGLASVAAALAPPRAIAAVLRMLMAWPLAQDVDSWASRSARLIRSGALTRADANGLSACVRPSVCSMMSLMCGTYTATDPDGLRPANGYAW